MTPLKIVKLRLLSPLLITIVTMLTVNTSVAQKTLTIASPGYEKTITLDGTPPEVVLSYTPDGMRLEFSNIAMKMVCIEDPSEAGVCRLQAYDAEVVNPGPTVGVPKAPSSPPTATAGDGAVALSWTAPDDNGAAITGYKIERVTPAPITVVTSDTGDTSTSYTVQGLSNGTGYAFRVAGINSEGTGFMSGASPTVTPTAGSAPVQGTDYASACNGLGGGLQCVKLPGNGDLEINAFDKVNIASGKTLVVPFIVESASNRNGGFKFDSFTNNNGATQATWEAWLSKVPGERTFFESGNEADCAKSGSFASATRKWSRGTQSSTRCFLGDSSVTGLLWLNIRFRTASGTLLAYPDLDVIVE